MNPKVIFPIAKKNLPGILSAAASGGVVLTAWLTHKADMKTLLEWYQETPEDSPKGPVWKIFTSHWKNYIPPVVAGFGTICCIAGAHKLHLSREAAMAAAVAFYKTAGEDFEEAVFEKFGDAGLKENVMTPDKNAPAYPSQTMKIRIWEPYTKQWFEATQQEILWAELTANKMLNQRSKVTLNDVLRLYSDPNIKVKKIGGKIGWSWDSEMFNEAAGYYWNGGWIDMCPQYEDWNGEMRFVMDYGIKPEDVTDF